MALDSSDFSTLAHRFRSPEARAIVLMGSFARGDAGQFSDVDLVRFLRDDTGADPEGKTHIVDGRLVVVSEVTPSSVRNWFTEPEAACECIRGARTGQPLWDPEGYFREIQDRARRFVWDGTLQEKANRWASEKLVGWAEEAHKGLGGLRDGHTGRLLNARFGLSWGLTHVMRVQRGVLLSGDNDSYPEVATEMGADSRWVKLSEGAFGLDGRDLEGQVRAGLALYVLTVEMLADALEPGCREVIDHTVGLIESELTSERQRSATD